MQDQNGNTLPRIPPYALLDAWRGIAALWVVMVHSCLAYIANGHPEAMRNPVYRISLWGQLGVVMFFVISGYCISGAAYSSISNGKSLTRYAADRFRRIYPPYLVACAAALAYAGLIFGLQRWHILPSSSSFQPPPIRSLRFWIANLTLTQLTVGSPFLLFVAWSLCYEVAFYMMIGIFLLLGAAGPVSLPFRSHFLAYACIITTAVSLIWLLWSPATCLFPINRWYQFGFGSILFFMVANGRWRANPAIKFSAVTCTILCVAYACSAAAAGGNIGHPSPRIQALVTVLFSLTLLLLQPFSHRVSHWKPVLPFMWLGTFSYSTYLVHTLVIAFPDVGLRRVGFVGSLYIVNYLVQIFVAVCSGWLFFIAVERHFISKRQERRIDVELREEPV